MTIKKKAMSPFAQELMQSLQEALAYAKGEGPATVTLVTLPDPPPRISQKQIRELRCRYEMTQAQFARLVNVSPKTVEGWEQGARVPGGAALRMLQVIRDPLVLTPLTEKAGLYLGVLPDRESPPKRKIAHKNARKSDQ